MLERRLSRILCDRPCSQAEERPRDAWRLNSRWRCCCFLKGTSYTGPPWGEPSQAFGEMLVEDQIDLCIRLVMIARFHNLLGGVGLVAVAVSVFIWPCARWLIFINFVRHYPLHDQICSKDGSHSSVLRMKGTNSMLKAFPNLFIVSKGISKNSLCYSWRSLENIEEIKDAYKCDGLTGSP